MKLGPLFAAVLLAGSAAGAAYWINQSSKPQTAQQGGGRRGGGATLAPAPVAVGVVSKQTVPVYREGIGNVQALNAVTVRSQVDGRLLAVEFSEGQDVKRGQVLARIDPVTFKANYDQAVAKKAQDEATLANAKLDLERYSMLAKANAGPKQQADQQKAVVLQLEAQIQSDQAAIDNTKAIFDYTTISAPLDGRIGLRQVDPGNIVHASDAAGIVSITQVEPIGVLFTLPQRDLAVTAAALAKGKVVVEIPGSDRTVVEASGSLQSIDNQIDVTTGTIKLKAAFPNKDRRLWPGQFVAVRVVVDTLTDVKIVPATAIRRGVDGATTYNFVYLVGADAQAHIKRVKVPLQDESIAVVEGDIDFGQTVVTEGFTQLSDGKAVQVSGAGGGAPAAGATGGATGGAKSRAPGAGTGEGKGDGKGSGRKRGPDGAKGAAGQGSGGALTVPAVAADAGTPAAPGNKPQDDKK